MIRLFLRSVRKLGALIADTKLSSVGCVGTNCGLNVCTSLVGLNAVFSIQYTGNAMTSANATPTMLKKAAAVRERPTWSSSLRLCRPRLARGTATVGVYELVTI